MLVNLAWLDEYLSARFAPKQVLEALTALGFEVEYSHRVRDLLPDIKVGFIREIVPHPQLPGRHICQVDLGEAQPSQIVCAAEHPVEAGWGVPIGRPGTKLPTGIEIGEAKYGGVLSSGMICLDREMGFIARGSGLQVLRDGVKPGSRLVDAVEIPDYVLELNVLPNRPDCMNLLGLARELVALLGGEVVWPKPWQTSLKAGSAETIPVEVLWPEACPRYTGRIIRGVKVGKSPMWLSSKLTSIGARSINNVVDILNYLLYVVGHPMHAFNLAKLAGPRICARRARAGERIALLDGREISLGPDHLVIADDSRPVALAGIMGGAESQTDESTTDVLLESACFDPVIIRKTSSDLGIRTESSQRYERGMDPNETLERAAQCATAMICELAGGTVVGELADAYPRRKAARTFALSAEWVNGFLGTSLDRAAITNCLGKLGLECSADLTVTVPTRRVDVDDAVVLIEDIARLTGYDHIPMRATRSAPQAGGQSPAAAFRSRIAAQLTSLGFFETRPFSLYAAERAAQFDASSAAGLIRVKNPITQDMDALRASLIPSLIDAVTYNQRRRWKDCRFFEVDRCFEKPGGEHRERWVIAGAVGGAVHERDWKRKPQPVDFYWLKGVLTNLLESAQVGEFTFRKSAREFLHPGQAAAIVVQGTEVGFLGKLHPRVVESFEADGDVFVFHLEVDQIGAGVNRVPKFQAPSAMPAVTRDLAFVVDRKVAFEALERTVRTAAGPLLEKLECFDVYSGEHVPEGKLSVGFALVFRAADRTLTTEEIAAIDTRVAAAVLEQHGGTLRG